MATLKRQTTSKSLVAAIADGDHDDDLRDIARACFMRRRVLDPDSLTGTLSTALQKLQNDSDLKKLSAQTSSEPDPNDPWAKAEVPADTTLQPNPVAATPQPVKPQPYNEMLTRLIPLTKGRRASAEVVFKMPNQKRYWRSDVEGCCFDYPSDIAPKALHGVRVKITSVDARGDFMGLLLSPPSSRRGPYYSAWLNDQPLNFSRSLLKRFL